MTNQFVEIPASKKSLAYRRPVYGIGTNDAEYITRPRVNGKQVIIEGGVDGLLVDVDNEEQLSQAISKVLSNFSLATSLGENARKTIETSYDLNKVTDKYLELYKALNKT